MAVELLYDNDKIDKEFLKLLADYDIAISFSKWTRRLWPVREVTFLDNFEGQGKVKFEFLQAILCSPYKPPADGRNYKYDLVLFLQKTDNPSENSITQRVYIQDMQVDDHIRFFVLTYGEKESVPNILNCKVYQDAIDKNPTGPTIPDTNAGGIVIKPI